MRDKAHEKHIVAVASRIKRDGAKAALPHELSFPVLSWLSRSAVLCLRGMANGVEFDASGLHLVLGLAISDYKKVDLEEVLADKNLIFPIGLYAKALTEEILGRVTGLPTQRFSVEELFIVPFEAGYEGIDDVIGVQVGDYIRSGMGHSFPIVEPEKG